MGACKNRLGEAVLTSTQNLCFGAKIRKIGIPLHTPILLYKSGVQGGIYYTDMFALCIKEVVRIAASPDMAITVYNVCEAIKQYMYYMSHNARNWASRFPTKSDTKQPVQLKLLKDVPFFR